MGPAIVLTSTAAAAVRQLPSVVQDAVGTFLQRKFSDDAKTHEPVGIRGVDGKFWVVEPEGAEKLVTLVIASQELNGHGQPEYVVTAVVPEFGDLPAASSSEPDPSAVALGAELLRLRPSRR